MPCQEREGRVNPCVRVMPGFVETLFFPCSKVLHPNPDASLVIADVCDMSSVGTDLRLGKGAVFLIL